MQQDSNEMFNKTKAVNSGQAQYLRSLDKSIRKKWNQLRYYRKTKVIPENDSLQTRKLQTEPI